jgi:hypothetical protein
VLLFRCNDAMQTVLAHLILNRESCRKHARSGISRRACSAAIDVAAATAVALERAVHREAADWQAANLGRS